MPNNNQLNDDRILLIKAIYQMCVQSVLIIFAMIIFSVILYHMITNPNVYAKLVYGAFDTILGHTLYRVYRYFFILPVEEKIPSRKRKAIA